MLLYQLLLNLYINFLIFVTVFLILKSFLLLLFKSTSPLYFYNFLFSKECFKCSFCFFKLRRMGALWLLSDNSNIWNLVPSSAGSCSCHFETLWTWSACSSLCTPHVLAKVFVCVSLRPNIKLPLSRESELSSGRPLGTLLIWVKFFFFFFKLFFWRVPLRQWKLRCKISVMARLCLHLSKNKVSGFF